MRLDGLAQQQPQQHRREKTNQHIERKALRTALAGQCHQGGTNFLPVHQDDGKDGPGLDGDVKDLGLGIIKTQQGSRQDQVARGGYGKKLGQALDHTHDGGLDQQYDVHARPCSINAKARIMSAGSRPAPANDHSSLTGICRVATILSMVLPSMSTTSKVQPSQVTVSVSLGSRPVSSISMPLRVW